MNDTTQVPEGSITGFSLTRSPDYYSITAPTAAIGKTVTRGAARIFYNPVTFQGILFASFAATLIIKLIYFLNRTKGFALKQQF